MMKSSTTATVICVFVPSVVDMQSPSAEHKSRLWTHKHRVDIQRVTFTTLYQGKYKFVCIQPRLLWLKLGELKIKIRGILWEKAKIELKLIYNYAQQTYQDNLFSKENISEPSLIIFIMYIFIYLLTSSLTYFYLYAIPSCCDDPNLPWEFI